jgi:S1-C subfamily serine protease
MRFTLGAFVGLGLSAVLIEPLREPLRAGFGTQDAAAERTVVPDGRAGLERAFGAWCKDLDPSVLTLYSEPEEGDARRSTGVVVGEDLVLAKLSEIGNDRTFANDEKGERIDARVLATDLDGDFALLQMALEGEQPIVFTFGHEFRVGQWVAAAGADGRCVAVGAVSVPPRNVPRVVWGLLGVNLNQSFRGGALIDSVVDGGAAAANGLRSGDVVLSIDGRSIGNRIALQTYLSRTTPGQEVRLVVRRGEEQFERTVRVRSRSLGFDAERPHAADNLDVSVRRDGFELAVQHDAHVLPRECLAPALDARGRVVGLHVARMDRPGSLLLPASVVDERLTVLLEAAGRAPAVEAKEVPEPELPKRPREV